MPRPRILAVVFLFLLGPHSYADDELNGSYDAPPSAPASPESSPPPATSPEPAASTPAEEEEAAPAPPPVPLPKPSLRFGLDEHVRFRHWLAELCRQEPLGTDHADRVHFTRDRLPSVSHATNKQGSLLLLLQNYAELAQFRDDCEQKRKKDPEACLHSGRVPNPWDVKDQNGPNAWISFGSRSFWKEVRQNRAPAGITPRTDLLAASREQVSALQKELKQGFFELRDAADLDGRPGTAEKARRLVNAVRSESTCGTRAVAEGSEPKRAPAQK